MSDAAEVLPLPVAHQGYKPALALTPAEAGKLVRDTHDICREILNEGTDYGVIPGTGSKPTMLKPGAEKLLAFFGLGHRMELVEVERDENKFVGVTYRCVVTKGDVIVATCDAYAGRDEAKWKTAPRNTVIKMAEKRALVGAALQATGTSALFTQDMEDVAPAGPSPYVTAAVETFKSLSERVRDELKAWAPSVGIKVTRPGEWTGQQVADLLLKAGTLVALEAMQNDDEVVDGEIVEEAS